MDSSLISFRNRYIGFIVALSFFALSPVVDADVVAHKLKIAGNSYSSVVNGSDYTLSGTGYSYGVKLNPVLDGDSPTLFYVFELPPLSAGTYESVKVNFRGIGKAHIYVGPGQEDFGLGVAFSGNINTIFLNDTYLDSKTNHAELKVGFYAPSFEAFALDYVEVEYSINTQNQWLPYFIREREAARVLDATADIIDSFSTEYSGLNIQPYFLDVLGNMNRPSYMFEELSTTMISGFSELASIGFDCMGILGDAEMFARAITGSVDPINMETKYSEGFDLSFGSVQWPDETADNIRVHANYLRTVADKWIEYGQDGDLASTEVSQLEGSLQDAQNRLTASSYSTMGTVKGNIQAFINGWKRVNDTLCSNNPDIFHNWVKPAIYSTRGTLWYDCDNPGGTIAGPVTEKSFILAYADSLAATDFTGTSGDPYQVYTREDLEAVNDDLSAHYILMNDINLAGVTFNKAVIAPHDGSVGNGGYGFFSGTAFTGSFNGNGKVIRNLTISANASVSYDASKGFFGKIDSTGDVSNLGLENCTVNSSSGSSHHLGGLVGVNYGSITNSYIAGTVSGGKYWAGGLVGINFGSIASSSSTGNVSGYKYVGGLVGGNFGHITNSYSIGSVTGTGYRVGGLVGKNEGSIASSSSTGNVSGSSEVGGLVGWNEGSIARSCSTGNVSGSSEVGGLVGENRYGGDINSSYSMGSVTGTGWSAGGLVGHNWDSITNSYSTSNVSGNNYVGGLAGKDIYGSITSSYSIGLVSGSSDVGGLVGDRCGSCGLSYCCGDVTNSYYLVRPEEPYGGDDGWLTYQQLLDKSKLIGFDFIGNDNDGMEDHWDIVDGYLPKLSWQQSNGFSLLENINTTLQGSGYENDPFIIADYEDLMEFKNNPQLRIGYYELTADINLAGVTYETAFISEGFAGIFDGNGFTISNLTIEGEDGLGFFSRSYDQVNDLGIVDCNIIGTSDYIGGLVGANYKGSITSSYSTGSIIGNDYVGGLVGVSSGHIIDSYGTNTVSGGNLVGGLVGGNFEHITNSYSTGLVTGTGRYIGGLVGENNGYYKSGVIIHGFITASYSTGSVNGGSDVGGLVGSNDRGSIANCYGRGSVSGNSNVGGLVGENYGHNPNYPSIITNSYSTGSVSGSSYVGGLVGYNRYGSVATSFWDIGTSGRSTSSGGTGKTTLEMLTLGMYTNNGWDFYSEEVDSDPADWKIRNGFHYPLLNWQKYLLGDFAGTLNVTLVDFSVFAASWLSELGDGNWNPICNLDNDGGSTDLIDTDDLMVFCENWLEGVEP